MSASGLTTDVDISPERIEDRIAVFRMVLNEGCFDGEEMAEVEQLLRALRSALTASEKRQDEAARLLRAVGAGGIFTLMAESSDDADVWYDQRDQFLEGK